MKLLVITRSAWEDSNSTGNTMTNLFSNFNPENIANIYVRAAKPNNKVCRKYFSLSDREVLRTLYKKNYDAGYSFIWDNTNDDSEIYNLHDELEERLYSFFRSRTKVLALWGQDLLWRIGKWRSNKLNQFLDEFQPDVIFSPCFYTRYTHRLLWYIQERTNARVALYHTDDYL